MCNWSESIIERERIDAIKRMIKANASKEQIIVCIMGLKPSPSRRNL